MVDDAPLRSRLGAGAEFRLIEQALQGLGTAAGVRVGPGDDAAVLDGGPFVVTVDVSVEGVHFRRDWMSPQEIGERAARSALSDLAAMAAEPVALLTTVGVDAASASESVPDLLAGVRVAAAEVGAALVGGDLTRVPAGSAWLVDVVAIGRAATPVLRSGGRPGDELWVTGRLGGAALAVRQWEAGHAPGPELLEAFLRPRPRIEAARWLAGQGVLHALIDLSDGLLGDAGHLAAASGLDLEIDAAALPLHEGLLSSGLGVEEARSLALGGGEDYELAFLAPPGRVQPLALRFERETGVLITRVGDAQAGEGRVRVHGLDRLPRSHDHFGSGA
ncbi:MAG: thiamine-phosphate kinase [Gemmatimonadota bacterium]